MGASDPRTAEVARLTWLRRQGVPAPEVLAAGDGWFVSREVVGRRTGADPWQRSLQVLAERARENARRDLVDLVDLDEERRGWTAEQLLAELDRQLPAMVDYEALAVTHGDWCLPNVVLWPRTMKVVGVLDVVRLGRADRCQDVALMARSIGSQTFNPQFGPVMAERLTSTAL